MRTALAGFHLEGNGGSWNPGAGVDGWTGGGGGCGGDCGCGGSCGGDCGCKGGGGSCGGKPSGGGGGKPSDGGVGLGGGSGQLPLIPDYDGEIWAVSAATHYATLAEVSLACASLRFYLVGNPDWYALIPKCPCTLQDIEALRPPRYKVEQDRKSISDVYHPGSAKCFRIKFSGQSSGNQCCFDADGNLITNGAGAGTPDRVGPISPVGVLEWPGYALDIAGHWCCDVFPLDCMWSLSQYLEIRPPYDDNCRANPPGPGGRKLPPKREPSEWELMVRYCENGCQNEAFLKASAWDWTFEEMDAYFEDCVDDCVEYFKRSHN